MRIRYLKNIFPGWRLVEDYRQEDCTIEHLPERERQLDIDAQTHQLIEQRQQPPNQENEKSSRNRNLLIATIIIVIIAILAFIMIVFYEFFN
jgi:hypothetical protein